MAPKKNVKVTASETSVQAVPKNLPGKRVKNTRVLKVPSTTTITIPNNKSNLDVPDTLRRVDIKTKIALANEVARSQILKEPVEIRTEPPKKRGRKKVVISELFTPDTIKAEPGEAIPTQNEDKQEEKGETNGKKVNKKSPVEKPPPKKVVRTRKRVADSTVKKPKIKRQRLIPKPQETTAQKIDSNTDTNKQSTPSIVNLKEPNVSLNDSRVSEKIIEKKPNLDCNLSGPPIAVTTKVKKSLPRGKKAKIVPPEKLLEPILELSCLKLPLTPPIDSVKQETPNNKSTKPQYIPKKTQSVPKKPSKNRIQALRVRATKPRCPRPARKKPDASEANNAIPVKKRQNSTSSISNLSWTRDISSSSTTTCITVSSNDVVCIDNKLPFIKLTNIDSEVDKYKPIPTVCDEDSSSDDSSSSDSDTSSEDQSSDSRHTPSCFTSPVQVNSLNLSSSSRNSIEDQYKDKQFNKPNYEKAAEKLLHALKKIDMEFVNWVHDTECVASDLNKIKDNLFTILKNEFSALKHCQNLQEMSNAGKIESPKIEREIVESGSLTNEKMENKNVEIAVKSNPIETNEREHNHVESATVDSNLVISKEAENMQITKEVTTGNNTERDNVGDTLFKSNHLTKCNGEISSWKSNRDESNIVTNSTEADHSNLVERKPEDIFIKPGTSGYGFNNIKTRPRRASESDESVSENEDYRNMLTNVHDDDDALSLFAESITGIESSRYNTSVLSAPAEKQFEEYIPKPIQNKFISPPNYSYNPTKIADQGKNGIVKTVCEKQNADSTSIYKDSNILPSESASQQGSVENNQDDIEKSNTVDENTAHNPNTPRLIGDLYTITRNDMMAIMKGHCYYNIIDKCSATANYRRCRFSHTLPSDKKVADILARLTDAFLIKEYMIIRRNNYVLRRYGMCVLFECVRRQLTRVVVEIAYDFTIKCDKGLQVYETKVAAIEVALLHLNNVDLSVCEDLLKLEVSETSLLCEVFMETMANTQNFSRFKSVFLSLTYFMVNNDRTFSLEVAEHLLERVCILPFDEAVVRALIQIMRLTNTKIFLNSRISHFEKIIKPNAEVYGEYISVKGEVNIEILARHEAEKRTSALVVDQPVLTQPVDQPLLLQPTSQSLLMQPAPPPFMLHPLPKPLLHQAVDKPLIVRSEMIERVPLPPSPDTTHLDNMQNKMAEDTVVPKITRTIQGFSFQSPHRAGTSPSTCNNEEIVHTPNYHQWRHRSIFTQIGRGNFSSPRPNMRYRGRLSRPHGLMRNRQFNHRLVTLGESSIMYPPPGPEF